MNRAFTLLLTFIYIMACNTVKKDGNSQNLKRVWMLTEFKQFGKEYLVQKEAYLDLTQPQNAASKMGCNQLSFPYSIKNENQISFTDGFATKMYCEEMKLENEFSKTIITVTNYSVNGHQLELTSSNGDKIVFVAQDWD